MGFVKNLIESKGSNVYKIDANATVFSALEELAKYDVGALVVVDKKDLGKYSDLIQNKLGYEYKPNAGVNNERLFHQRKIHNKVYHLHLTYKGNESFIKDISFRDYLIKNPSDAKKYENNKTNNIKLL